MNLTFMKLDWRSCAIRRALRHVACRILMMVVCIAAGRQALAYCDNLELGVPGTCDQIVNREGYALGFSVRHRQALWVTYRMTGEEASAANVSRRGHKFYTDCEVSGCATLADYKASGYDRGHLAPAGDMKFSERAMLESFSLANASPQVKSFNCGVWHRLETLTRKFAIREKSLFVVTGPIFDAEEVSRIGASKVSVPKAFYKVIFDETPPMKMIGFIIPNKGVECPISSFAVTVDEVEQVTGLDFFSALPDEIETDLESQMDRLEYWEYPTNSLHRFFKVKFEMP